VLGRQVFRQSIEQDVQIGIACEGDVEAAGIP
jgi:hypothetical protein